VRTYIYVPREPVPMSSSRGERAAVGPSETRYCLAESSLAIQGGPTG